MFGSSKSLKITSFQFYETRQKLSIKGSKVPLPSDATLKDAGIEDGGELSVKDLGPQISWQTVFMIEYVRCAFFVFNPCGYNGRQFPGWTFGHTSPVLSPHPIVLWDRNTAQHAAEVGHSQYTDDTDAQRFMQIHILLRYASLSQA